MDVAVDPHEENMLRILNGIENSVRTGATEVQV